MKLDNDKAILLSLLDDLLNIDTIKISPQIFMKEYSDRINLIKENFYKIEITRNELFNDASYFKYVGFFDPNIFQSS